MSTTDALMPIAPRMKEVSPEYAEILMLGNVLHASGYFKDVRDQAQAVTKILFGRELGFSPIVSMSGIYIIEGKPALSANLLAATIKRSGKYDYRVTSWDATRCEIMFKQKVDGNWEDLGASSFTEEDAKKAGVWGKNTWAKYPKAMLFARALSQGERAYCPDVSSCALYVPEELGANVNESGEVLTAEDLPKSARPVAVTTEDIPISAPRNSAQGETKSEGHKDSPKGAVPIPPLPPVEDLAAQATAAMSPKEGTVPDGCIELGQQANFSKLFKDSLAPKYRKNADSIRHEWLKRQGIVDSNGEGTSRAIRKESFYEVRESGISFAKEYAL